MLGHIILRVFVNFFFSFLTSRSRLIKEQLIFELYDNLYFFLDFCVNTMSNSSFNSTDKLDVGIPIKESVTMTTPNDTLKKRYIQIGLAVALYWYRKL